MKVIFNVIILILSTYTTYSICSDENVGNVGTHHKNLKIIRKGVFDRLTPKAYSIPDLPVTFVTAQDLQDFKQLYQKTLNYLQQRSIEPKDTEQCEQLHASNPDGFDFCKFVFKGYASYGDRYLKYQLAGTASPKTPAFFMVLSPERQDPWNYFYLYLYDPQQLPGARDDLSVIKGFKALRWGVYQQKPGATGTGKDGPVVLSHKMTEIENGAAVNYFTKKVFNRTFNLKRNGKVDYLFRLSNIQGYTVDLYSMSYNEQGNLYVSVSFAPLGGYAEFSYEFLIAVKGVEKPEIMQEKFRINESVLLNSMAVKYNNQLRKELQGDNSYQATMP